MLLLLLSVWLTPIIVPAEIYPECTDELKFNTFVASKDSCSKYIFCDGENSFEGECPDDNIFDEIRGYCDDPDIAVCNTLNNGNSNNINNVISSYLPPNINGLPSVFYPSSLSSSSSPSLSLSSPSVSPPPAQAQCSLNNGIKFPNPASCASYYTCYNGIAIPMICGLNMYFNEQSGKCEPQEKVYCALENPIRKQCSKGMYGYMPHPKNCNYYYLCSNGFLTILHCPLKFTWDYERHTCVRQSQSKCFPATT